MSFDEAAARAPLATAGAAMGGKRHVVFVTENAAPQGDTRVWAEATSAVELGYDVTVIGPAGGDRSDVQTVEGITVMTYPLRPSAGGPLGYVKEYTLAAFWILRLVARVHTRHRVDLVHVANPPDFLLVLLLPLKLSGVKFVFDHHDLAPELFETKFGTRGTVTSALRLLERLSFRFADGVVSVNESYAKVAAARGSRASRVVMAPNYPDLATFTPTDPDLSLKRGCDYLIVWVGVMGRQDGVDLAVKALGHLAERRRDWHAVFAGRGDMLVSAQQLASSLGLDGRLDFPGHQSREAVRRLISTADVCLSVDPKTRFNDLSTMIKVVEYLAIGRPVVASDLTETRRLAGDAAVYVSADSPTAFAEAIDVLLSDRGRREAMGARGRQRMLATGGWEVSAGRIAALYEELLAAGRPGGAALPEGSTRSRRFRRGRRARRSRARRGGRGRRGG